MAVDKQFLAQVLPKDGYPCAVGIKNKKVKQLFVNSIDELAEAAEQFTQQGFDTYFACATYKAQTTRTQDNVAWLKSFFIDLDCGEGKPYATQAEALAALKKFADDVEFPLPTVVNSGRGIHAYWILEAPITKDDWLPLAGRFKGLLAERGLKADPAVTSDAARILRVPGTRNFKVQEPGGVVCVLHASSSSGVLESINRQCKVSQPAGLRPTYATSPDAVTEALIGNIESDFKKIANRTYAGDGCDQLRPVFDSQETTSEPLWRAALSIAQYCKNSRDAIHIISVKHPKYSKEETERKAAAIKGPYTCATFKDLYSEPCEHCKFWGKITSPIQLGSNIKRAPEVVYPPDGLGPPEKVTPLTDYPKPYFRGENGGIYKEVKTETGDKDFLLVYEHDFFVTKRFNDSDRGDVIEIYLKLPHDEERRFTLALRHLADRQEAREKFAEKGVALTPKSMDNCIDYIIHWANHLQHKEKAEVTRAQMGWTPEETFILGDTEITTFGPRYTPPAPATMNIVSAIGQKGKLEEWEGVLNLYGKEGMEAQAFSVLAGIGAILFKWSHCDGVILNLLSKASGSGKTTLCHAVSSAYGHPKDLQMMWDDTRLFKYQRIGVMCNLPVIVDEITNWPPEIASDFAYGITQGRGRHRLRAGANEERLNITKWATIAVTTSNASLYDKLSIIKSMPEGELYRIFEIYIERLNQIPKEDADKIFYKLSENYGHAGFMFADFVVNNLADTRERLHKVRADFDKAVGMVTAERNWSALMACAFTTGLILTKDLGLLKSFNLDRIYNYMKDTVQDVRRQINKQVLTGATVLGLYINEIIYNNTLVIESKADKRSTLNVRPSREPRGKLLFRVEPDMKHGFLSLTDFRSYCAKQQMPYGEVVRFLQLKGMVKEIKKVRLGKGTDVSSPPVECLVLDLEHPDFDIEVAILDETPQA